MVCCADQVSLKDTSHSELTGIFGVGVRWQATTNIAVRAQYEHMGGHFKTTSDDQGEAKNSADYGLFSLGLEGRF